MVTACVLKFLSIQTQDFIEELTSHMGTGGNNVFLSIQAQDFIEDQGYSAPAPMTANS